MYNDMSTQFSNIQFSDGQPIQFWYADCATWNESSPEGIRHKKFCQPVNCDDTIRIEFVDSLADDTNFESLAAPGLSTFVNHPKTLTGSELAQYAWSLGATPSVFIPSAGVSYRVSQWLYHDYEFSPGYKYKITFNYTNVYSVIDSNPRSIGVFILDTDYNSIFSQQALYPGVNGSGQITLTFTATADCVKFAFFANSGSDVTLTVTSYTLQQSVPDAYQMTIFDENDGVIAVQDFTSTVIRGQNTSIAYYYKSFKMSDYSICDKTVRISIYKSTGTPDVEVLKSDGISVKTSHSESILVSYSNHRNFGGLYYSNVSPDQEFSIRIPAIFFEERYPTSQETMQLSSNRVISLNSQLKVQRLLSTDKMPQYMHLKMNLVLMSQTVYINDVYWVNEEGYQKTDAADKRDPFQMYTAWLTKKEYVVRNIL